ncbi:MAG: alpha/beta fold hydrolase [Candidatus Micrarchaeaceae archaeon]
MDYDTDFVDGYQQISFGSLHFRHHHGGKKRLVFLHGLGGNTRAWSRLMQYMSGEFDIWLLDLLGHGGSDAPALEYNTNIQFQALREFISIKNLVDSYIVGHSYGGWIAAFYASQHYASTCKGIVLIDAAGLQEEGMGDERKRVEEIKTLMKLNNNREHVIRSVFENVGEFRLGPKTLAEIKVPALIIWGANDDITEKGYADMFAERIANTSKTIIENAGHYPHYTNPEEVAKLITEFVSK